MVYKSIFPLMCEYISFVKKHIVWTTTAHTRWLVNPLESALFRSSCFSHNKTPRHVLHPWNTFGCRCWYTPEAKMLQWLRVLWRGNLLRRDVYTQFPCTICLWSVFAHHLQTLQHPQNSLLRQIHVLISISVQTTVLSDYSTIHVVI